MATSMREEYSCAGLIAGGSAWAANTQIDYAFAEKACAQGALKLFIIDIALALFALTGGLFSFLAVQPKQISQSEALRRAHSLIATVGTLAGVLLGVVIIAQGAAILILQRCPP